MHIAHRTSFGNFEVSLIGNGLLFWRSHRPSEFNVKEPGASLRDPKEKLRYTEPQQEMKENLKSEQSVPP
jgi:hypothetical protein